MYHGFVYQKEAFFAFNHSFWQQELTWNVIKMLYFLAE